MAKKTFEPIMVMFEANGLTIEEYEKMERDLNEFQQKEKKKKQSDKVKRNPKKEKVYKNKPWIK